MIFCKLVRRKFNLKRKFFYYHPKRCLHSEKFVAREKKPHMSSKEIRKCFIDYFAQDKAHTYVHSSPVFLNNDPTLLFVNAGMNQFKSLLLGNSPHNSEFSNLKRVVNSQKCIRISGKHNDLDQVGHDFHHHTFFEMLGNWSFGDYFKKEACEMAWELLTKVYGLPEEQLYITYFGGDKKLQLAADEECRNIWLNIGVRNDHIFPFGVNENFWDMGDVGPCGPCTEIHYDYLNNQNSIIPAAKRLNAGRSDLIEIWNLVFTQYTREQSGRLESLSKHNVDTGLGLERLTAVLQGTTSNYDTDIFTPLFDAIEKNFNVRPYKGLLGKEDVDGIDTAYRIIADHCRMSTVAISDGLFPDSYDAGHILRKIIRKAAYMANCCMKTRPGQLSTLVPYVVESLDFFPELGKHTLEVTEIVNDEEKMLHQVINRGRKLRNKMASKSEENIFEAKDVWQLYNICGLDENIIDDLSAEIGFKPDWPGYRKFLEEELKSGNTLNTKKKSIISSTIINLLKEANVPHTIAYEENDCGDLSSKIESIIQNNALVNEVIQGQDCFLLTKETNFLPVTDNQTSDIGQIFNENFYFKIDNVYALDGYIFHHGNVTKGSMKLGEDITMSVIQDYRKKNVTNHTAVHLLHAAVRQMLPYTSRISTYVDSDTLQFNYCAKNSFCMNEIEKLEISVNDAIQKQIPVHEQIMSYGKLLNLPNVIIHRGESYGEIVKAVTVGNPSNPTIVEPCQNIHLQNVSDIGKFVIINSKVVSGTSRAIFAVTGDKAQQAISNGMEFENQVKKLHAILDKQEIQNMEKSELTSVLKDVKKLLNECNSDLCIPWSVLKNCEAILKDMKFKLVNVVNVRKFDDKALSKQRVTDETLKKWQISEAIKDYITRNRISPTQSLSQTEDYFHNHEYSVKHLPAVVLVIFQNNTPIQQCETTQHCIVMTDKTTFYATDDHQIGDKGTIFNEDCLFTVTDTHQDSDYIFHEGWVEKGTLQVQQNVQMEVDSDHRKLCSLNNTACCLLYAALKKLLPFVIQSYAFIRPLDLQLNFHSQSALTLDQLQKIENVVNEAIQEKLDVSRSLVPYSQMKRILGFAPQVNKEKKKEPVSIVSIGNETSALKLTDLCVGTHASNTADIENFVIVSSKMTKTQEKVIYAVTNEQADEALTAGELYDNEMTELESKVESCLQSNKGDCLEYWDLLKEIKVIKNRHDTNLPVITFRKHQDKLTKLTVKLTKLTASFVQAGYAQIKNEMEDIMKSHENSPFIVYKLNSLGDGKRLVNYALKTVPNKPCIFFANDGHKTVICSCSVPQECVTPSFSALLWIQPVATFLEGRARFHSENPELNYSIESCYVQRIEEALELATNFIKNYL